MKKILFLTAALLLPLTAHAQEAPQGADEFSYSHEVLFDADGNGRQDRILVLTDGCEGKECPIVLVNDVGYINLGFSESVETGYVSPEELGVNDPKSYPENVPVINLDGVIMAFDGKDAYPVSDMISAGHLAHKTADADDVKWVNTKLSGDFDVSSISAYVGDINGDDVPETVYSVYTGDNGQSSTWFIKSERGGLIGQGYSFDYPRIYRTPKGARILSVSAGGLGVTDIEFKDVK